MKTPHYLRFVQALVLSAAVPACAAEDAPAPSPQPPVSTGTPAQVTPSPASGSSSSAQGGADTAGPAQNASASDPSHADAGVDSSLPFSSGPIVPPELPPGLA